MGHDLQKAEAIKISYEQVQRSDAELRKKAAKKRKTK